MQIEYSIHTAEKVLFFVFCTCLATTWWQAFIGTSKKAKQYEKPTTPSYTKSKPWKTNSESPIT